MARSALPSAREGSSFADWLSALTDDQFVTLLQARPDLATPAPANMTALAAKASTWASLDACMRTLDQASRDLLDALCLLPHPTTVDALVRLLATDFERSDLDAALARLTALALAFRDGDALSVHPQMRSLRNPAGLGPPLATALASQDKAMLDATARRLGAQPGRIKSETVDNLVAILASSERIQAVLRDAPEGVSALAARLSEHSVATVTSGTYYIRPETPLGWLAGRGFLFASDWETVVMPREVGLALRGGRPFPNFGLRPPGLDWQPVDAAAVQRSSVEAAVRVVADIVTVLDVWGTAPAKLLKAGGVGVRDLRRAATAIGRTEIATARLLELAAIVGLVGWDWEAGTALPCPVYDEWLHFEVPERWASLVTSWLATDLHISLAGAIGTNGKPIPPLLPPSSIYPGRHRRRVLLAALLEGQPGQAMDAAALPARLIWEAPAIWDGGPALPETLVDWAREEAELLGIVVLGAVSSIGRAIVTGRIDEAMAGLAAQAPRITSQFVIQADLTAVATGPLAADIRTELELMADLESSGSATVYRFTEATIRRAFDAGHKAPEIIRFLEAFASKGVPQPLAYLVDDVGRRHGRVRVGPARSYIRSDDPSLLAEILVTRKAAKLDFHQLAPTVLVSPVDPEVVVATLRAVGYLPAEEMASGAVVIRRREATWAREGHGAMSAWAFDPVEGKLARERAGEVTDSLAAPDSLASVPPFTTAHRPEPKELRSLVRRLRAPRSRAGSDSVSPKPPLPNPRAKLTNQPDAIASPLFQLDQLDDGFERPTGFATSRRAIMEYLDLSHMYDWWLHVEYVDTKGRHETYATVFNMNRSSVTVGTMPHHGTRILNLGLITSVRVLSEAEEKTL